MVTAITMTNANEAIGLTRAAQAAGMPVAIAFTVETDGRLPTGQSLKRGDRGGGRRDAATRPAYYMINCAHPTHFDTTLAGESRVGEAHPRHPRQCLAGAATPSSTRRPTSMPAIRSSWAASTARCGSGIRRSTCSAAAAAPIRRISASEAHLRGVAKRLRRLMSAMPVKFERLADGARVGPSVLAQEGHGQRAAGGIVLTPCEATA